MNDLLIISKLKETTIYINKILINFPKINYILKNNIEKKLYSLLENIYIAIYDKNNRIDLLYNSLVKIKMIDFYLRICLDKKIINYKKFVNICSYLNEIIAHQSLDYWSVHQQDSHKSLIPLLLVLQQWNCFGQQSSNGVEKGVILHYIVLP